MNQPVANDDMLCTIVQFGLDRLPEEEGARVSARLMNICSQYASAHGSKKLKLSPTAKYAHLLVMCTSRGLFASSYA